MNKLLAALCVVAMTALPSFAQEKVRDYEPYPYTFITLQGGGQVTFTNASFNKLVTPIGAFSVGHFFTPAVGARIGVQGWNNKAGYKIDGTNETYKFKYATSNIDLMFNLTNMICPKRTHAFNVILLGGVGLAYAWDKDGQDVILSKYGIQEPLTWGDDRLTHNFRVGMQLEANVAKNVGVNLEVAANNMHDRFNAKQNGKGDWQATALLGVTFKFGFKKKAVPVQEPAPVVVPSAPKPEPKPEPKPTPAPAPKPVVKEKAKTRIDVFFTINSSEIRATEMSKVETLAQWLKQHPTATVNLTGYADAGTGTKEINQKLSEKRAEAVTKKLVEEYNIDAARIKTDFKGDTVQPFTDNDSNRAVIALGEEQ